MSNEKGLKLQQLAEVPVSMRGLVQQIKSFERTASEAAVSGDYKKALLAMAINPLVLIQSQKKFWMKCLKHTKNIYLNFSKKARRRFSLRTKHIRKTRSVFSKSNHLWLLFVSPFIFQ